MRIKSFKGCFIGVVAVIGFLIVAVVFFFAMNNYSSPVREAGRNYRSEIKSFENEPIDSMDDVYERMEFLRNHYHSPTHSKMQGGTKTKVTLDDINTLFGEADKMIEDVTIEYTDNVYQYKYGEETLNIHERWDEVEEYVFENFSGEIYNSQELDDLFFKTVKVHQTNYKIEVDKYKSMPEKQISELISNQEPTREVRQAGWYQWSKDHAKYFDDGKATYSPEEYFLMVIDGNDDEMKELDWVERRYREAFKEISPEELAEKRSILNNWSILFEDIEEGESDDIVRVQDLSNDFGELTQLTYNPDDGALNVSWVLMDGEQTPFQISGQINITERNIPMSKEELLQAEVVEISKKSLYGTTIIVHSNGFIGQ